MGKARRSNLWGKISSLALVLMCYLCFTQSVLADCPSADHNGDCFVDFEDFSLVANQWSDGYVWEDLTPISDQWLTTDPCVPDDMAYIPDGEFNMGDHHDPRGDGNPDELPVHAVLLDSFFMSKYETSNSQYCDYLNDANPLGRIKIVSGIVYASSDDSNSYPYCDTNSSSASSQLDYDGSFFSVKTKGGRDMSSDPMVTVTWYGAVAYCNWRTSTTTLQAVPMTFGNVLQFYACRM